MIAIIQTTKVSVAEAKNKLTQLIAAVEKGERVTVCRHGKPVVDIVPTQAEERQPRIFGGLKVRSRSSTRIGTSRRTMLKPG